jgi:TM2 domain-containing membrane protein YozV
MTTPPQPPPWPGDDERPRWPGDDRPQYGLPGDQARELPPPPPGYGQAREQVRPEPQEQYGYSEQPQAQYSSHGEPPPPRLPVPYQAAGQPQPYYQAVVPHSLALAVIASFFIPGLGSMLNNKVGKGVGILACSFVAAILCLVLIGFVLSPIVWIWGMLAGYQDAQKWNRDHGIMS